MTYRILSLDGGGSWALLQAMALNEIFGNVSGHEILSHFDLAAANSGGSIVLGGLAENKPIGDIIALFENEHNRRSIFAEASLIENLLSHIPIFPKYSSKGKLEGLTKLFGDAGSKPMSALNGNDWVKGANGEDVKILIPAFDYDSSRAHFFRSYTTQHGATADVIPLVQAVHASSNAPVKYFDAPAEWNGYRSWDGAMAGLNNPLMVAVNDAISCGIKLDDIVALSIGTGTVKLVPAQATIKAPSELTQPHEHSGIINDLVKATGCITDDPPDMATFTAHTMLTSARTNDITKEGPVVRLNPVVRPVLINGVWQIPPHLDPNQFHKLTQLDMDAVKQADVELIMALGASWMADGARNQPIRMRSDNLSSSLGSDIYSEAKKRWSIISQAPTGKLMP